MKVEDTVPKISVVEPDFTEFYRHVVKTTLSQVLGQSASISLLYHTGFDGTKTPKEFHQKLVLMFGHGAYTLEKSIIREMFANLRAQSPHADLGFDFETSLKKAQAIHAKRTGSR